MWQAGPPNPHIIESSFGMGKMFGGGVEKGDVQGVVQKGDVQGDVLKLVKPTGIHVIVLPARK